MSYYKALALFFILILHYGCRESYETSVATGAPGKYGLQRTTEDKVSWVTAPVYDAIHSTYNEDYFLAEQKGKWGIIDSKGNKCTDIIYDTIVQSRDFKFLLKKEGGMRVADIKNKLWITTQAYDTVWFSDYDDLYHAPAFTRKNGKYGLISGKGKDIISGCDTIVWAPHDCHERIALFMQNSKCGVMKTNGHVIVPVLYDSIGFWPDVDCRRMALQLDASMHYINHGGREMKPSIDSVLEGDLIHDNRPEVSIGKRAQKK